MISFRATASSPVFFTPDADVLSQCGSGFYMPPQSAGTTNFFSLLPEPKAATLGLNSGIVDCSWDEMEATNRPVALWLSPWNLPWGWTGSGYPTTYSTDYPYYGNASSGEPDLLARAIHNRLNAGSRVEYIFADIETNNSNITYPVIDAIVGHYADVAQGAFPIADPFGLGNPTISGSVVGIWDIKVGNYGIYPQQYGTLDKYNSSGQLTSSFTGHIDPTGVSWTQATVPPDFRHDIYYGYNDLNLSMPIAYFDGTAVTHADGRDGDWTWSDPQTRAPTGRAAMFWSALERVSIAARECEDHTCDPSERSSHVLPFVSPYFIKGEFDTVTTSSQFYGGWFPPPEDFLAFVKHIRLRGTEGFVFWRYSWYEGTNSLYDYLFDRYESATWYDANAEFINPPAGETTADWFVREAIESWENLNFQSDAVPYRYSTDKDTGVFVSAMNDHGQLAMQISVLDESGTGSWTVDINDYFSFARDYALGAQTWTTQIIVDDASNTTSRGHTTTYEFFTPDISGNHAFDLADINLYTAMWQSSDARADWNKDGIFDLNDLNNFLSAFADTQN